MLQRESGPVRNDSRNLEIMDLLIYHDSRQDNGASSANECGRYVFPAARHFIIHATSYSGKFGIVVVVQLIRRPTRINISCMTTKLDLFATP